MKPNFSLEQALINSGNNIIAGTDEVGRGSWAGPVTAAAVILDPKKIPVGLNDSKKLPKSIREKLALEIMSCALKYSIIHIDVQKIDMLNILQASMLAMHEAVEALEIKPNYVLVDGNIIPKQLKCPAIAIVKGDGLSLSIAAASVIAKVARDKLMMDLAQHYPHYSWETNVGYGTKAHIAGLSKYGITPHHRVSFKPIHNML